MEESIAASQARGPSCSVKTKTSREDTSDFLSLSCEEYERIRDRGDDHILLDVRVKEQFDLCSLPGAINIPLGSLSQEIEQLLTELRNKPIYCICRRGIASVKAIKIIAEGALKHPDICAVKNITGGLNSWRSKIDERFPKY